MNVGDFFERLSYGELSGLSIGMEGGGTIDPDSQNRIVSYTKTALTGLYSRFAHNISYVKLELVEGLHDYKLNAIHAVSNEDVNNTDPRYILDSVDDPFTDNVVKVLAIAQLDDPDTVEDESKELRLNVHPSLGGLKMPSYDKIYVPNPIAGAILNIEYQADHPKLSLPADETEEIYLAPLLHEALEMRVAARVYNAMSGEAHVTRAQLLQRRYEHLCLMAESKDLLQESETSTFDKVRDKGFV